MIKRIEIADKAAVEDIRRRYNHIYASHSFNMMFAWKDIVGDELYLEEDMYSLHYTAKGDNAWMFPVGDDANKESFIREHINDTGLRLCYMRDEDVCFLRNRFPDRFEYIAMPDDSEYVYEVAKHVQLSGKLYKNFRHRVNAAKREHPQLRIEDISDDNISDAKQVIMEWRPRGKDRGALHLEGNEAEIIPCDMWKELDYYGIVIYLNDRPIATALGYQLSDDVCDLAIRKTIIDDCNLGYYTGWLFTIRAQERGSVYINYEDDLGITGLRQFKTELHPDYMNNVTEAYTV